MKVELLPHIAQKSTDAEGKEHVVEFDQWALVVDGKHCGWVPKKDGAHIALFVHKEPAEQAEIKRQVEDLTSGVRSGVSSPMEHEEQEEDDDEDDSQS